MKCSCGIIFINEYQEILLCHVTGHTHWDIPKGMADENEAPLETAVRECYEETGINVNRNDIVCEIPRQAYSRQKQLHTFIVKVQKESIVLSDLVCRSMFLDEKTNTSKPEVDDYAWMNLDDAIEHVSKNMKIYLPHALSQYHFGHNPTP